GLDLKATELSQLGRAAKVVVSKENTTIVEGSGNPDDISSRVNQLRAESEESTSEFDKEKLQERLAKLTVEVDVVKVAAELETETELKERKLRLEDALNSTRAAVEEGIVSGGGTALINVYKKVAELGLEDEDEITGANIVLRALEEPVRQITENAGLEGSIIV